MPTSCGGSTTLTVNVCVALKLGAPLSVTTRLIALVVGAVVGVQVKWPLKELTAAPAGALVPRLNVSVCAGKSASLALAVNDSVCPKTTIWLVIMFSIGAVLGTMLLVRGVAVGIR